VFFAKFLLIKNGILSQELFEPFGSLNHVIKKELDIFGSGSYRFRRLVLKSLLCLLDIGLGLNDKLLIGDELAGLCLYSFQYRCVTHFCSKYI
jgi:hypothetical protein